MTQKKAIKQRIHTDRVQHCQVRPTISDDFFTLTPQKPSNIALPAHHPETKYVSAIVEGGLNDIHIGDTNIKVLPPIIAKVTHKKFTESVGWRYRLSYLNLPKSHCVWVPFKELPIKLQNLVQTTHASIPSINRECKQPPPIKDQQVNRVVKNCNGNDEISSITDHYNDTVQSISPRLDLELLHFKHRVSESVNMTHVSRTKNSKRLFSPYIRAKFQHKFPRNILYEITNT